MKSSKKDLLKRGYITDVLKITVTKEEVFKMLLDKEAIVRSKAVKLLINEKLTKEEIQQLIQSLIKEKALYTKIYTCELLSSLGTQATLELIPYLGIIKNNQYLEIPNRGSKKKSYPLPRDMIARTLAKASIETIPLLLPVLESKDVIKIAEVLDAIGFLLFYHREVVTMDIENIFYQTYDTYKDNPLLVWKITTCLSAFTKKQSKRILDRIEKEQVHPTILEEIERTKRLQGN